MQNAATTQKYYGNGLGTLTSLHLDFNSNILIMPWQSAGALLVVVAAFNVAAGLVGGIHYLSEGVSSKFSLQ
jgi:hypothetical protein